MFEETLQSEEHCLWFDDDNTDDELDDDDDDRGPLFDDCEDDDGGDDDDAGPGPKLIDYRCSPVCRLSPTVRTLIHRHSEQINELLNVLGGALSNCVYVHAPYPPYRFTSRTERIYHARHLTASGELEVVRDELRAERDRLEADLLSVTGDSPRAEFRRIEHHLRDYRILVALAGCHHEYVFHWWDTTLIRLQQSESLRQYYRARDAMRAGDPEERRAARARDAKRRKTRGRQEYLTEFEARPEVRAKRAERKRAARAAARGRKNTQGGAAAATSRTAAGPISDATPCDRVTSQHCQGADGECVEPPIVGDLGTDGAARAEVQAA